MTIQTFENIELLFWALFFAGAVLYVLTLYNTLKAVPKACRKMKPGLVWLIFIPFFNYIWQFVINKKLSDSINAAFIRQGIHTAKQPGLTLGIINSIVFTAYPVLLGVLHNDEALVSLSFVSTVLWIAYWITVSGYKKKLKQLPPANFAESYIFGNSSI